jgi:DNA-binding SARP family transcriptional activator
VQVEVLGTVQIRREGRLVEIPSRRMRAALGLLALEVGRCVSTDRLVDAVWGAHLPRFPEASLRTVVSRLRVLLDPVAIEHGPAGYRLVLAPELVDAFRFTHATGGLEEVASALDLWRGDPVPELGDWDEWILYAEPLRERRLSLEEQFIATQLEEGATDLVVAHLRSLAAAEPTRQRRWVMLAAALTTRGWDSEAAAALERGRVFADGAELSASAVPPVDPTPRGSLIGREDDVDLLSALLADGLVHSVVGAPGVGKSSLVRVVAARSPVPAKLVDLSGASSADEMLSLIAYAIGCVDMTAEPALAGVLRTLDSAGSNLLVLDGCDAMVDNVAAFALEVHRRCPMTRLLIGTRTQLGVRGEIVHHLSELRDDESKELMRRRLGTLAECSDSSAAIDILADHTSGVPLAIELAAAEAALLGIREAAELYAAGVRRDADAVIGAAIERTVRSLPDESRSLLFRLSIVDGPFSIGCAAAVGDLEIHECARSLGALAAHSLLTRDDSADRVEYLILPPLRHAVSTMASGSDHTAALEGLRSYAMTVANRIRTGWIGPEGPASTRLLHRERSVLRSAVQSAIESGDAVCAVAVSGALLEFGFRRVDRELFQWAEAATTLQGADRQPGAVRAHALAAYGSWYRASREGIARHLAAIDKCEEGLDEPSRSGFASALRAVIATFFDNEPGAARHWIAAARMPDPWWRLYHLGVLELVGIDTGWSQPVGEVASALADELNDATGRLFVAWGQIGRFQANLGEAVDHLEQLLADARNLGDVFITGAALLWLIPARATSDRRAALEAFVVWIDHWLPTGDRVQLLTGLAHLRVLLEQFGLERAFELADSLVRSRASTSWHVVETEQLIGHSEAVGVRTHDASAQARFRSSEFDRAIRALREEIVTASSSLP